MLIETIVGDIEKPEFQHDEHNHDASGDRQFDYGLGPCGIVAVGIAMFTDLGLLRS